MGPQGKELIRRYKETYGIPEETIITEQMILNHWNLEKQLTLELLESSVESRWETFQRCYTRLYKELKWLNRSDEAGQKNEKQDPQQKYSYWRWLIGSVPKRIYEIGSGKGELITYLASLGYECTACEVTPERGEKWTNTVPNLSWAISDGINFGKFEKNNTYDVVISDQVIEHLHPDDLINHFKGVLDILADGGRYILRTPHTHIGPSDISRVFKKEKPEGMHLKEYSYQELIEKLRIAGFANTYSVPLNSRKLLPIMKKYYNNYFLKSAYTSYLCFLENLVGLLPTQEFRNKGVWLLARKGLFMEQIILIAEKRLSSSDKGGINN